MPVLHFGRFGTATARPASFPGRAILEESKIEDVVIRRRKGDRYVIVPNLPVLAVSPFDVPGLNRVFRVTEIVEALRSQVTGMPPGPPNATEKRNAWRRNLTLFLFTGIT